MAATVGDTSFETLVERLDEDVKQEDNNNGMIENGLVETKKEEDKKGIYLFVTLFYLLGTACFVPQSFYISSNEYWMYKFRDPSLVFNVSNTANKTYYQKNFTAFSGITGNVGMIAFVFVTLLLHKKITIRNRIIGGMSSLLVLFTITLIFTSVDTDSYQGVFFGIFLCISALLSSCVGVLMVSVYQLASKFPPRCLASQLAGQAVCGILSGVIQVISLAIAPTPTSTAALYFSIATATVLFVLIFYIVVLNKSELFKNKLKKKPKDAEKVKKVRPKLELATIKRVFGKMWMIIASIVLCVANSGMLHPGLTALIESSEKGTGDWGNVYFIPVVVFLLQHLFEFIGRETSNHIPLLNNRYIMLGTSAVRLVFFPLILLCNIQPRDHLPVVFYDDAYFIIFLSLLTLSGGYLLNIAILAIPKYTEPEERTIATLMIVLIMVIFVPIFAVGSGILVNLV